MRISRSLRRAAPFLLLLGAIAGACGDGGTSPGRLPGNFDLSGTSSGPLPYAVTVSELGPYYLIGGAVEFASATSLVDVRNFQQYAGDEPAAPAIEDRRTFSYRRSGDSIFITRPFNPAERAHVDTGVFVDRSTLVLRVQNPYGLSFVPVSLIYFVR